MSLFVLLLCLCFRFIKLLSLRLVHTSADSTVAFPQEILYLCIDAVYWGMDRLLQRL